MSSDQSSKGLDEQTMAYYEANAQRFFENTHAVNMDSIYEPFLSLLPSGAHILDTGCGSGRDSRAFLERGYEVTAMDASEAMVELASQHIGRPVLHMCNMKSSSMACGPVHHYCTHLGSVCLRC